MASPIIDIMLTRVEQTACQVPLISWVRSGHAWPQTEKPTRLDQTTHLNMRQQTIWTYYDILLCRVLWVSHIICRGHIPVYILVSQRRGMPSVRTTQRTTTYKAACGRPGAAVGPACSISPGKLDAKEDGPSQELAERRTLRLESSPDNWTTDHDIWWDKTSHQLGARPNRRTTISALRQR